MRGGCGRGVVVTGRKSTGERRGVSSTQRKCKGSVRRGEDRSGPKRGEDETGTGVSCIRRRSF